MLLIVVGLNGVSCDQYWYNQWKTFPFYLFQFVFKQLNFDARFLSLNLYVNDLNWPFDGLNHNLWL